MERLCGRPIDSVRGLDWFTEFLFEGDRASVRRLFDATHDTPVHGNINAIRGRDGEPRLIEWHDRKLVEGERSELAERFELFADRADEVFFVGDYAQGRLLYLNAAFERVTGISRELVLTDMAQARDLIHPDDRVAMQRAIDRQAGPNKSVEFRIQKRDSEHPERPPELRWIHVRWSVVGVRSGDLRYAGTASDVTEQRRTNQQLEELGRVLELLEAAVEEIIVVIDASYEKLLYVSKSIERLGSPRGSVPVDIRAVLEWIHPDDHALVASSLRGPNMAAPYVFRARMADGGYRWFETRVRRLGPGTPLPGAYVAIGIDVTARHQSEVGLRSLTDQLEQRVAERTATLERERIALRESAERLSDAQRIAEIGDWEWEATTDTLRWSDQLYRIFGREAASHIDYGVFMASIHPDDREMVQRTIAGAIERREPYEFEHRVVHPDGDVRIVHCLGEATHDADGRPLRLKGTSQDITRRKLDEARLRASLAEKEALLHEIHHRVKNNLQVVASLLYLEGTMAGDEARAVLDECNARVRSMALVHDYLYHSHELSRIDMAEFMRRLGDEVARVFGASPNIRIVVSGGGLRLDIERAVPTALLVNELLTNALKYAYPHLGVGDVAEIRIRVAPQSIEIEDDGVGLPPDLEQASASSLGLRLVHSLARQLDARFCFVAGPGTRARLDFALDS
jgi:PAS domain S-box-containing protein